MKSHKKTKRTQQGPVPTTRPVPANQPAKEAEYETSPDAPYNRKSRRPLGSSANERPSDCDAELERTKQYFHGGKRP
jgi:hypothetical protein